MRLVLITGLSGSGKSTVAKCFEDLDYYCVDNLPLSLLGDFLKAPQEHVTGRDAIAVVTDVRAPGFASEFPRMAAAIDRERVDTTLLFLEASEDALVRRFSETRRPHPLAGDGAAVDGIRKERELLAELRASADLVIDSSEWSIHEMRAHIFREFAHKAEAGGGLVLSLMSFGFKHGIPKGADLVFDIRFLPNPHFVPGLRELTGRDPEVSDYLHAQPDFLELAERLEDLLRFLRPRFERENRSYLTVAIGCTGGKHRSVGMVERLRERLSGDSRRVRVDHRDLGR